MQAVAIGAGGYVGYRAGSALRSAAMPAGRKRTSSAITKQGFRTKIRRRNLYGKGRKYRPSKLYRSPTSNFHTVVLKDLKSHTLTSGADLFSVIQPADLMSCPAWTRYANYFQRFRILKIHVTWNAHPMVHQILSFESQDSKTVPTSLDFILKQPSCRIHDHKDGLSWLPGRTMYLSRVPRFQEFYPTDTVASNFSVSESKETDAGLIYGVKHQDATSTAYKIECTLKFTVQFQGVQETMEIDT